MSLPLACLATAVYLFAPSAWAQLDAPIVVEEAPAQEGDMVAEDAPAMAPVIETSPHEVATTVVAPLAPSAEVMPVWYEDLAVNAFLSTSYTHNFAYNDPRRISEGRAFDLNNDSFKLDIAQLALQNEPEALGDLGFRLDLAYGTTIPVLLGINNAGVEQGFISYLAPVGRGLKLDVGIFLSHLGSETIEGFEAFNDTISRSFLFTWGIPKQLTGLRAYYVFNNLFSVTGHIVNNWRANVLDNNAGKTFGISATFTPVRPLAFFAHYLGGPERTGDDGRWRHLFNGVGIVRFKPITVTAEALLGRESAPGNITKTWSGLLGSVRWDACERLALTARAEYFDNRDELSIARLQAEVFEATLSPSFKLNDNAVLRAEIRHDRTVRGGAIFNNGRDNHQTTVAANLLFVF